MMLRNAVVAMLVALPVTAAAAPSCHVTSGDVVRPLVELYTSEGCDSCPPADRWLSATFGDPRQRAIPLAFHVDYWDRLGWKDRFADARYTARQHVAATANGKTFVYTPQVLVQGRDTRWQEAGSLSGAAAATAAPRAAVTVDAERTADALRIVATARIDDARLRDGASIAIAYVDSGLVSDVKAGENRGVQLRHDHVVRALHGPYPVDASGTVAATLALAAPREPGQSPQLVAFVQDRKNGEVLQTLSLPACR